MKFYNPFKPHIVEFTPGWFAVRKLPFYFMFAILGGGIWVYMDKEHNWYFRLYDPLTSLEKAKERLNYKKPPEFKPKVHIV
jgi:hypothetical protein